MEKEDNKEEVDLYKLNDLQDKRIDKIKAIKVLQKSSFYRGLTIERIKIRT